MMNVRIIDTGLTSYRPSTKPRKYSYCLVGRYFLYCFHSIRMKCMSGLYTVAANIQRPTATTHCPQHSSSSWPESSAESARSASSSPALETVQQIQASTQEPCVSYAKAWLGCEQP